MADTDSSFVLQNVLGNSSIVPQKTGLSPFATPEALTDQYQVSVLHAARSRSKRAAHWELQGVVRLTFTKPKCRLRA